MSLGDIKNLAILGAIGVGAYLLWDFTHKSGKDIAGSIIQSTLEQKSLLTTMGNPITVAPYEWGKTIGEAIAKPWVGGLAAFTGLFNREGAPPLSPGGLGTGDNL